MFWYPIVSVTPAVVILIKPCVGSLEASVRVMVVDVADMGYPVAMVVAGRAGMLPDWRFT